MVGTLFPHKLTFLLEHNLTQNTNIQIHSHPNFQSPKKKKQKRPRINFKEKIHSGIANKNSTTQKNTQNEKKEKGKKAQTSRISMQR